MKRRDTIVRYTAPERINHWITAFCFILNRRWKNSPTKN